MSKGDETREMILHRAAQLFTRRGFYGSAMSDVMEVTGLEKGGLYNHFKSKDELALEAFDYAVNLIRQEIASATKDKRNTVDRLLAMMSVFRREAEGYPLAGGCPVMNTAIEADDAHPALRQRAEAAMDEWHQFVRRTVQRGKEKGEIRPEVNGEMLSTVMISIMEGGIMQSKLYGDMKHVNRTLEYLTDYIEREVRAN